MACLSAVVLLVGAVPGLRFGGLAEVAEDQPQGKALHKKALAAKASVTAQ